MYIVESGRVRVSVCHADGQEKTLYVADTGAMIGESDCILGQPYSSTATVVLPSRVRAVPSALVQELFHADPVSTLKTAAQLLCISGICARN